MNTTTQPAPQPAGDAFDFRWLIELFQSPTGGNSLGHYHTGFTDLGGNSRTTENPHEARRYATREEGEHVANKLHHLQGVWRCVEHGFEKARAIQAGKGHHTLSEDECAQLRGITVGEVLTKEQWEAVCSIFRESDGLIDRLQAALAGSQEEVVGDGKTAPMEHLIDDGDGGYSNTIVPGRVYWDDIDGEAWRADERGQLTIEVTDEELEAITGRHPATIPDPAAPDGDDRTQAEHVYTMQAFDYASAPIGSRDWVLFYNGWRAALSKPRQSEVDDANAVNNALAKLVNLFDTEQKKRWAVGYCQTIATAYFRRHPPTAIPDGMVVVPREPTPEMVDALCNVHTDADQWPEDYDELAQAWRRNDAKTAYVALIAAAPGPAEGGSTIHNVNASDEK